MSLISCAVKGRGKSIIYCNSTVVYASGHILSMIAVFMSSWVYVPTHVNFMHDIHTVEVLHPYKAANGPSHVHKLIVL